MPARSSREQSAKATDRTVYPTEGKVGEESLQRFIIELLRPLVERWLAERRVPAFTGADQFIYYRKGDATRRIAPDLFVLPGVRPGRRIGAWKTWVGGVVPSFALEVVSTDVDKDYIEGPERYSELGVTEFVIFDPDFEEDDGRFRFQVFRQVKPRGFKRTVTNEDRIVSKVLGCHLRAIGSGESTRLRLATGADGAELVPTDAEESRYERAEKERERAEKERERAEKERERAGRIAAEQEIERLRALLGSKSAGRKRRR